MDAGLTTEEEAIENGSSCVCVQSIARSTFPQLRLTKITVQPDIFRKFFVRNGVVNTSVPPGGELGKGLKCNTSLVVSYQLKKLKRKHVKRLQCAHFRLKGCVSSPPSRRPRGRVAAKCGGGVEARKRSYQRVRVAKEFLEESNGGGDSQQLEVNKECLIQGVCPKSFFCESPLDQDMEPSVPEIPPQSWETNLAPSQSGTPSAVLQALPLSDSIPQIPSLSQGPNIPQTSPQSSPGNKKSAKKSKKKQRLRRKQQMEDLLPSSSDDMEVGRGQVRQLRSRQSERVKQAQQKLNERVVQAKEPVEQIVKAQWEPSPVSQHHDNTVSTQQPVSQHHNNTVSTQREPSQHHDNTVSQHHDNTQREPSPVSQHHDNTVSSGPAAPCEDVILSDPPLKVQPPTVKKERKQPSKREAVKKQLVESLGGIQTRQKSKDAVRKTRQQAKGPKGVVRKAGGKLRKDLVAPCQAVVIARSKNATTKTPAKGKKKIATTTGKKKYMKRAVVSKAKSAELADLLPYPEEGAGSRGGGDVAVEKFGKKGGGHLPSAEDSGYTQSSDGASSRNSRALDSNSPLLFPLEGEGPDLPCVFDDSGGENCCLNQDPNLHSNMNDSSILEPKCPSDVHCLSDVARLSTIGVESEACLPSAPMSPGHREDLYKDGIIFPELEEVLNMSTQPEAMFEPKDLVVYGATGASGMEEGPFGGYSVETILDSEGISDWLREFGDSGGGSAEVNVDVNNLLAIDPSPEDRPSGGAMLASGDAMLALGFQATGFEDEESPAVNVASVVTVESEEAGPIAAKKKRGRPRKPPPSEVVVKRPRGRPRKRPLVSPDKGTGGEGSVAAKKFKPEDVDVQKVQKKAAIRGLVWNSRTKSGRNICPSWKVVESLTDAGGVSEKAKKPQQLDSCGGDDTLPTYSEQEVKRLDPGKSVAMEGCVETAKGGRAGPEAKGGRDRGCGGGGEEGMSGETGRRAVVEMVHGEGDVGGETVEKVDGGGGVGGDTVIRRAVGAGDRSVGRVSRVKQRRRPRTVIHLKKTPNSLPVPISPKHCSEGDVVGASPHSTRELEVPLQRSPSSLIAQTAADIAHTKSPASCSGAGEDQPPSLELAGKSPPPKPDPPQQATPPEDAWRSYLSPVACSDMPPMEATPLPGGGHYLESVNDLELGKLLDSVDFDLSPEHPAPSAVETTPPPIEATPPPMEATPPPMETTPLPVAPEATLASAPVEAVPSKKEVAVSVGRKPTGKKTKKRFICKVAKSKRSLGQDGVVSGGKLSLTRAGSQEKDGVLRGRKLSLTRAGSQDGVVRGKKLSLTRAGSQDGVVRGRKLSLTRAGSQEKGGVVRGKKLSLTRAGSQEKGGVVRGKKLSLTRAGSQEKDGVLRGRTLSLTRAGSQEEDGVLRGRKSLTPCRSPPPFFNSWGAEWAEDDCIDIHPTEEDQFATDVGGEDPLSRIFPYHKPQKTGNTKRCIPAGCDHAPSTPGPGTPRHYVGTPFQTTPSLLGVPGSSEPPNDIQPLVQRGLQSRHARLQATRHAAQKRNSRGNPESPMADVPPLNSQNSCSNESGLATPPPPLPKAKYCHPFLLKGWCKFPFKCCYVHTAWDEVPINVLEEVMVAYPTNQIPPGVTQRYTPDPHSSLLLQAHLKDFIQMLRHMLSVNLEGVVTGCELLGSMSIRFNAPFLCRLLSFFDGHAHHEFTEVILASLKSCHLSSDDRMLVVKTMIENKLYANLKDVYSTMGTGNIDLAGLSALFRSGKDLGEWIFQLLADIKLCDSQDGKECGLFNQFIRVVDYQLLLKPANLEKVVQYLDTSHTVTGRLAPESFSKLCRALQACQLWGALLSLFHRSLRLLPSVRTLICEPLECTISNLGMSEKMMSVFERLSEEQKRGLSNQAWNKVMSMFAQKGRSQRATKLYSMVSKLSKHLSSEVMFELIELFKKQHNTSLATTILCDSLRRTPPLIPPLPLLTSLNLGAQGSLQDLHLVVSSLLQVKTKPPLSIMEGLVNRCSSDKCYSKLAQVVKLARDCGVALDRRFYQSVLLSLQQWGQDQEAVAEVLCNLGEGVASVGEESWVGVTGGPRGTSEISAGNWKRKTLRPVPPPPSTVEAATPSQPTAMAPADLERPLCVPASPNLEEVMGHTTTEDLHQLLRLIEFNGKLGQFRAVASILMDINPSVLHSDRLVLSIWEAITSNSKIRKPNAFSMFLTHLHQCRSSAVATDAAPPLGSCLLSSDRWVVSQLGVALLKLCERNKEWQSGYVVLHNLHRFGIHYVKLSQPFSSLPPLLPHPPTPCSVALSAVNVCLHVDKETNSALEVMRGCEWVVPTNEAERDYRTEVLATLAQRCLDEERLDDAWQCLEAVERTEVANRFLHHVTNLHNKLLQGLLNNGNVQSAVLVFRAMQSVGLQSLPSVFSGLLQLLCSLDQKPLARELCSDAIANKCYAPLVKNSVFDVTIPLGLIRLELQLLLEDCLRKVALEVANGCSEDLTIHLSAGCRDLLEQVLTQDLATPLPLTRVESKLVVISSCSLAHWCGMTQSAESAEKVKGEVEGNGDAEISAEKEGSEVTLNGDARSAEEGSEVTLNGDAERSAEKGSEVTLNGDARSGSEVMLNGDAAEEKGSKVMLNGDARSAEKGSEVMLNGDAEKGSEVMLNGDAEKVTGDDRSDKRCAPAPSGKQLLKLQKAAVCLVFAANMKPHCNTKFSTKSDYTHLLKQLALSFFTTSKTFFTARQQETGLNTAGKWEVPVAVQQEVAETVLRVLSKFTTYSIGLDGELELSGAGAS